MVKYHFFASSSSAVVQLRLHHAFGEVTASATELRRIPAQQASASSHVVHFRTATIAKNQLESFRCVLIDTLFSCEMNVVLVFATEFSHVRR